MTILSEIPEELVAPVGLLPLEPAQSTAASAAAVRVGDDSEGLVAVPARFGRRIPYNELPLAHRSHLVLRASVVDRLALASAALPEPFGFAVLDGWRSVEYQRELLAYYVERFPALSAQYVADPDDPRLLPPHTTGGAVDLTLTWNGIELALGTDYDSFADAAHVATLESDASAPKARDLRRLLSTVLRGAGFAPYPFEWWHWSYGDQWWAAEYGHDVSLFGQVGES
jgi:D-alanyl-D-alanine dipeptidase